MDLLQSFDARDWAKEFIRMFGHRKENIDEELMITWFSNALMKGYDFRSTQLESEIKRKKKNEKTKKK